MKIGITGTNGFVGKALKKYLIEQGIDTVGLSRSLEKNELEDITTLVHCGWAGVAGKEAQGLIQQENIRFAEKLIERWKQNRFHLIGIGSQAEYALTTEEITEDSKIEPRTEYGKAKVKVAKMFETASSQLDLKCTWLRLFDPYGPGDKPYWIIPYVIESVKNETIAEMSECTQIWDFIYIEDVCTAIHKVISLKVCGTYNLCSGDHKQLKDTVKKVASLATERYQKKAKIKYGIRKVGLNDPKVLRGSNSKLIRATGWRPLYDMNTGLEKTVYEW